MSINGKELHKKFRIPGRNTVTELKEKGQKKISKTLRYLQDRKVRHKLKVEAKEQINKALEENED